MRAWKIRMLLVLAVALPVCMVVFLGPVQAQFRPGPPPINTQPPKFPNINPPNFNPPNLNQPKFPNINPPGINQPQFPNINPPIIDLPKIVKTWTCSRCGANLGNGDFPPAQCPSCKARIINGVGGGANLAPNPPLNLNPPPQNNMFIPLANQVPLAVAPSSDSSPVGYILGAFAGFAMMIGGIVTALKCGGIF